MKQFRQGDLYFRKATKKELRGSGKKANDIKGGRLILAYGEATGHTHSVDALCANLFKYADNPVEHQNVLVVDEPTTVVHDKHPPIEVDRGTWFVIPEREADPLEDWRLTAD